LNEVSASLRSIRTDSGSRALRWAITAAGSGPEDRPWARSI
jgi:hypothetical protein